MKFVQYTPHQQTIEQGAYFYNVTSSYIEVAMGTGLNQAIYYYMIFRDESSVTFAACLDTIFNKMPVDTDEDIRAYQGISPTAATLMRNAVANDYLSGALIRTRDLDDGQLKYFVVSFLENVVIESCPDFFERQILRPSILIVDAAINVLTESIEKYTKMELAANFGTLMRSFFNGMTFGLAFRGKSVSLDKDFLQIFTEVYNVSDPADPRTLLGDLGIEAYIQKANADLGSVDINAFQ